MRLTDKLATLYLAEQDLKARFQARRHRGRGKEERGLALLAKAQGKCSPVWIPDLSPEPCQHHSLCIRYI
jgi:hypothetical protein